MFYPVEGVTLHLVNIKDTEGATSIIECSRTELSIGDDCLFRGKVSCFVTFCHFLPLFVQYWSKIVFSEHILLLFVTLTQRGF